LKIPKLTKIKDPDIWLLQNLPQELLIDIIGRRITLRGISSKFDIPFKMSNYLRDQVELAAEKRLKKLSLGFMKDINGTVGSLTDFDLMAIVVLEHLNTQDAFYRSFRNKLNSEDRIEGLLNKYPIDFNNRKVWK
jgi:hypothetical protein